jgi:deoxyribodipyrimidine photo-lyase
MKYLKSIYIFHRSLRLIDNLGLMEALENSDKVIPVFIFTPEQISEKNKMKSLFSIVFMIHALKDLNRTLKDLGSKLFTFYGEQDKVLDQILKQDDDIQAVYVNTEYTSYGIDREDKLLNVANQYNCDFFSIEDYLLHPINEILTGSGSFYSVFTPFYNKAITFNVTKPSKPSKNNMKKFVNSRYVLKKYIDIDSMKKIYDPVAKIDQRLIDQRLIDQRLIDQRLIDQRLPDFEATRKEALKRTKKMKDQKRFEFTRDNLELETTKLSPYIKFGLISIREVYHEIKNLFGKKHHLIKQLYWREFYYNLAFNRQDLFDGASFRPSYDNIVWKTDVKLLKKWKTGTTGYPIVDAGIRELNQTGYMHNRARLITSNFLVKHLFIDWRHGEKHFAQKLIDYDPSVNNGNWQFSSGSGADSQPYFRMMNPWTQGLRHDPNASYIIKWIPELADVPPDHIHDWENHHHEYRHISYPKPCVKYDFQELKKKSKKVYSKAFYH